ncbi:MAG: hypothetical protein ACI4EX_04740 [Lachnospiraceae bacterium]
MKAPQYFIDLPVEGHILGTLWILSIGLVLDKNSDENNPNGMYEHSYGNRLRRTLINKVSNDVTYSPSLFEPYFAQYESWRDYGLECAKERLDDKQDAIILTLDFKSFYYCYLPFWSVWQFRHRNPPKIDFWFFLGLL